jgi:tetratricopeptide (TPR) repeat protein
MRAAVRFLRPRWLPILVLPILAACSAYRGPNARVRELISHEDYAAALAELGEAGGGPNEVLGLLERGLLLHYAGDHAASNDAFQRAEASIDELYTRRLTTEAASLLTSDRIRPYTGRDFERLMVHVYRALNYVALDDRDDALVEARKASAALAFETISEDDPAARDDPFVQYITGLLYEWGGQRQDAYVSYRRAEAAYVASARQGGLGVPGCLGQALMRTAGRLGLLDEAQRWRSAYSGSGGVSGDDTVEVEGDAVGGGNDVVEGEVVVVLEVGFLPWLVGATLNVPILKSDDVDRDRVWVVAEDAYGRARYHSIDQHEIDYWLKIDYPVLRDDPPVTRRVRLEAGQRRVEMDHVADLAARAADDFERREKSILVRTIARALLKYVAKREAEKHLGEAAGILANLVGVATEAADTRAWWMLPHDIHLARTSLPAGAHDLVLSFLDGTGRSRGTVTLTGVDVRPGEITWVTFRSFR